MTKEQQDLAWQCLPKEARDEIKSIYTAHTKRQNITSQDTLLDKLFGKLNLTSDKEPPELLFVERKKIINICKDAPINIEQSVLYELFGNKCLPDKEPSVQCESKFKFKYDIDDKVLLKGSDKPMLIRQRVGFQDYDNGYQITTLDTRYPQWVKESELAPYTEPEQLSVQGEPKFNKGDKVKVNAIRYNQIFGAFGIVKCVKKRGNDFLYTLENNTTFRACYLEPYTEPETKTIWKKKN